jgi:hypothetical protein
VNILLILGEFIHNCNELVCDYPGDVAGNSERKSDYDQDGGGPPDVQPLQPIYRWSPDETQDQGKGKRN